MNLKAESGFGAWWVISALGFQLPQSGLIPLLASPSFPELSPYIFCLDENISPPRTNTKVSNEPYPPPHFRLPGHVPIPLFQYSCLWGHWVWEREKGAEVGSLLLWGCWVCRAHFHAYQRAITCSSNPSHTPPQQPSHKKGRGAKPSPAAMGVTIC